MAPQNGRKNIALIERVLDDPEQFEFFQAVRILMRSHRSGRRGSGAQRGAGQGLSAGDAVRFRSVPSFGFPAADVSRMTGTVAAALMDDEEGDDERSPQLGVTFMGLTGPSGVLPNHYTRLLCERLREGDPAFYEFLDLFHHRLVSLFFEAWGKYQVSFAYEQGHLTGAGRGARDDYSNSLFSLIGLGTDQTRERLKVSDESLLFYAAHFAGAARSPTGLAELLSDYFDIPVMIRQFQGRWFYLSNEDLSRLPTTSRGPAEGFTVLGMDFVVGTRVWNIQSTFRIVLGPLTYGQFQRFLPRGRDYQTLQELTRLYVGSEFDFDVQPVLAQGEIPCMRLSSDAQSGFRLGWNSWICSASPESDATDVVLSGNQEVA